MGFETIKNISINKLYDKRYLQTANRVFLHPRGVHVNIESDSKKDILNTKGCVGIWNYNNAADNDMITLMIRRQDSHIGITINRWNGE